MPFEDYLHLARAPSPGAPLIFVFHGTDGDENQFFKLTWQMMPDAGILSPHGLLMEFGANRFFRRLADGVCDMEDPRRADALMAAILRAHADRHPGHRSIAWAIPMAPTSSSS